MDRTNLVACVTGASGMVGKRIVKHLIDRGYKVRALTRQENLRNPDLETFHGDIRDSAILTKFLGKAQLLFHCAAELTDQSLMWGVNVEGTKLLFDLAAQAKIHSCCFMGSAGVVGQTDQRWVDELTPCHPRNLYEKSKWAAERLALQGVGRARVVILRPTNVIDDDKPGALALPRRGAWSDRLQVLLKGGECAHIIHAEDVAAAAVHSIFLEGTAPQIYLVSCDHEPYNTYAGLWSLYRACQAQQPVDNLRLAWRLPVIVPHMLRRLRQGPGNRGDVRYSASKLLSTGFHFPLGLKGAVQRLILSGKGI